MLRVVPYLLLLQCENCVVRSPLGSALDLLSLYDLFKTNMLCGLQGLTPISLYFQPARESWGTRHWISVCTARSSGCQWGSAPCTTLKMSFLFSPWCRSFTIHSKCQKWGKRRRLPRSEQLARVPPQHVLAEALLRKDAFCKRPLSTEWL